MQRLPGLIAGALVLELVLGCSNSKEEELTAQEGPLLCCEIGAVCHWPVSEDPAIRDCHAIGRSNDATACVDNYERCMNLCVLQWGGEGGEGGAPVVHVCASKVPP